MTWTTLSTEQPLTKVWFLQQHKSPSLYTNINRSIMPLMRIVKKYLKIATEKNLYKWFRLIYAVSAFFHSLGENYRWYKTVISATSSFMLIVFYVPPDIRSIEHIVSLILHKLWSSVGCYYLVLDKKLHRLFISYKKFTECFCYISFVSFQLFEKKSTTTKQQPENPTLLTCIYPLNNEKIKENVIFMLFSQQ